MQVPTLDLKAQYEPLRAEIDAAIKKVIDNTAFILGPAVSDFEKHAAEYLNCKHAVGVSSGTDAILIALMAEGIGHGDEVISTGFTFFATTGTIHRSGATPVLVDIDPYTYNIDPAKIEAAITEKTKAIVPVHLYGQAADMPAIMEIAEKHNLVVIEDAAQAIGTEIDGKKVGTYGHYGCFSFFPSKNLGACGDAGLVVAMDDERGQKLKQFRMHGQTSTYMHQYVGGNFRIDAIHAAVLDVKLPHLDSWTEGRQKNAASYKTMFEDAGLVINPDDVAGYDTGVVDFKGKNGVILPKALDNGRHIYNQYVIRVDDRDGLLDFLNNEKNIGARVYYPLSMHQQDCFAYLGMKEGDLPVSECASKQVMALPIYPELTEEMLQYVVDSVKEYFSK